MKSIAIMQSNYIPWKGYFDMINLVDEFILFDDVQYTKRTWRNRNTIKTPNGPIWLTIPVLVKNNFTQTIRETRTAGQAWRNKHWRAIEFSYRKSPFFETYRELLANAYEDDGEDSLSRINRKFIETINAILGISTRITSSSDYGYKHEPGSTRSIARLLKAAQATAFLNGPTARQYMNADTFKTDNIDLIWMDYSAYPEYRQPYPPFEHAVSILDLLLSEGPRATAFMKSFQEGRQTS